MYVNELSCHFFNFSKYVWIFGNLVLTVISWNSMILNYLWLSSCYSCCARSENHWIRRILLIVLIVSRFSLLSVFEGSECSGLNSEQLAKFPFTLFVRIVSSELFERVQRNSNLASIIKEYWNPVPFLTIILPYIKWHFIDLFT